MNKQTSNIVSSAICAVVLACTSGARVPQSEQEYEMSNQPTKVKDTRLLSFCNTR